MFRQYRSASLVFRLALVPVLGALVYMSETAMAADDGVPAPLEASRCPPPGLDGTYVQSAHFYYIADVDANCSGSPYVHIKHVAKNLDQRNTLPFEWEGTLSTHIGLLPGRACCNPIALFNYDEEPVVRQIRFGTGGSYSVPASTYPLPIEAQLATPDRGGALVGKLETEYLDSSGEVREILINIESRNQDDDFTLHKLEKKPADLVLALGGVSDLPIGDFIAKAVGVEFSFLEKSLNDDALEKLPSAFREEAFLVIPAYAELPHEISVPGAPTTPVLAPIAVMTEEFEPIVTHGITLLSP